MRALVVYESMFGNARTVAEAIAEGLETSFEVEVVEVGSAPATVAPDVDLVVVGGPTHQFGLPRPESRQEAAKHAQGALVSRGVGLREWLATLETTHEPTAATAFATRMAEPRFLTFFGHVARQVAKRLRGAGFEIVEPPQSFFVTGMKGPLKAGERERAVAWGASLAETMAERTTPLAR